MTTRDGFNFDFETVNPEAVEKLLKTPGVDSFTISNEGMDYVGKVLGLDRKDLSEEEIRAIRNAVVEELYGKSNNLAESGAPFKEVMAVRDVASAVVAVIDHELFRRGYPV